jgi:CheY-like chemotaxis protein
MALIVLDLMLPGMDGAEFRARQLQEPAYADIPVVVSSAATRAHLDLPALRAAAIVEKPFRASSVVEVVRRHARP